MANPRLRLGLSRMGLRPPSNPAPPEPGEFVPAVVSRADPDVFFETQMPAALSPLPRHALRAGLRQMGLRRPRPRAAESQPVPEPQTQPSVPKRRCLSQPQGEASSSSTNTVHNLDHQVDEESVQRALKLTSRLRGDGWTYGQLHPEDRINFWLLVRDGQGTSFSPRHEQGKDTKPDNEVFGPGEGPFRIFTKRQLKYMPFRH